MLVVGLLASGCAGAPGVYRLTAFPPSVTEPSFDPDEPQIEVGRPNWFLDGLNGYVLSLPVKLLLWNWHVMDHEFPEDAAQVLRRYLWMNGLEHVKVRDNQYAPLQEWRRLRQNGQIGAGYRYTLGVLSWLRYTLLPDRLLGGLPLIGGGDHFNPFSNTINVYSSDVAILLHEAGHAKDYAEVKHKGTFWVLPRFVPFVDTTQEASASRDAIRFLYCIDAPQKEVRAYKTLIPAYGTYFGSYIPGPAPVFYGTVLVAHVGGRIKAASRQAEIDSGIPATEFERPSWCQENSSEGLLSAAAAPPD